MDNLTRKARGLPYCYDDPELLGDQHIFQEKMMEYNLASATETEKKQALLKEVLAEIGTGCTVEPPLNANWGCRHVHIGNNVWIGSGAQIMPGVSIGDNSVIGAGSVVTNDIPTNVVAFGVPCRVQREIGEKDKKFYYKNRKLDIGE